MSMDTGMDDGMKDKASMFKCPSCGEMLKVEAHDDDGSDMSDSKPMMKKSPKMNAGSMPMHDLKSKISSPNSDAGY